MRNATSGGRTGDSKGCAQRFEDSFIEPRMSREGPATADESDVPSGRAPFHYSGCTPFRVLRQAGTRYDGIIQGLEQECRGPNLIQNGP